jgi:hypothetical protein
MFGMKIGIGTGVVAVVLAVAIAVPAGAQHSAGPVHAKTRVAVRAMPPAWLTGLRVRSEALNRRYGLGAATLRPAGTTRAAWLVGLSARSDALNRKYKLGAYAVPK